VSSKRSVPISRGSEHRLPRITQDWDRNSESGCRSSSYLERPARSWRPTRSEWVWTRAMYGWYCITRCPESWSPTTRRRDAPGGTALPPSASLIWDEDDQRLHMAFLDRSRPPLRVLKRVTRSLRCTIGAGERGFVEVPHLLRAAGCVEEELWTLLAALERHGVVRVYNPRGSSGQTLDLGVRSSRPDWAQAQRLRDAGAEGLRAVRDRYHRGVQEAGASRLLR